MTINPVTLEKTEQPEFWVEDNDGWRVTVWSDEPGHRAVVSIGGGPEIYCSLGHPTSRSAQSAGEAYIRGVRDAEEAAALDPVNRVRSMLARTRREIGELAELIRDGFRGLVH